jgi:uncharacterized protein YbjT (DUF2867 family)
MKILLFGATGMVGDGVLRWLIASPRVTRVVAVSRKPLAVQHPKLATVIEPDMFHLQHLEALREFDACFFCLGASSVGMSPEDYRRLTYDLTVGVARQLLPGNPRMVFEYISGEGTDANSRQAWARVKAETETALSKMGFRDVYALRPGMIQPMRRSPHSPIPAQGFIGGAAVGLRDTVSGRAPVPWHGGGYELFHSHKSWCDWQSLSALAPKAASDRSAGCMP